MAHFLITVCTSFGAIIIAVLAAPQLYEWFGAGAPVEFHRLAKTLILIFIIAATLAMLKLRRLPILQTCGFTPTAHGSQKRAFAASFAAGVLILLPVAALFHLLDLRVLDASPPAQDVLYMVVRYFFTALLIATIEESFFRGVLMDGFIKQGRRCAAVLLPAAVFALLHFIAIERTNPGHSFAQAPWYAGVQSLIAGIAAKHTLAGFIEAGAALFMAGVFLSLVRLSCGHVVPCIGIHCGWVAAVKIDKKLTDLNETSDFAFLIADYDRFIGWGTFLWFTLLTLALVAFRNRR